MSKFSEGTRVVRILNNEVLNGTVKTVYEDLSIAIVNFDNGDVLKVGLSELGLLQEKESEEAPEEKKEPKQKEEITITPDEFTEIVSKVVAKMAHEIEDMNPIAFMGLCACIMGRIHKALFVENVEND